LLGDFGEQLVRHASKNAGAIAAVLFVTHATAVLHTAVHVGGIGDDLVAWSTFDVTNEANSTAVFFVHRIVQTARFGQSAICNPRHISLSISAR